MGAARLSQEFAACVLGDRPMQPDATGSLVGLEHEYRVFRGGEVVDFRSLVAGLRLGRRHLDPSDANAYRMPSGCAITCDEIDAETALAPLPLVSGITHRAVDQSSRERASLQGRLGDRLHLRGYSTHISVAVDAPLPLIDAAARLYARRFAVPLMLLLDRKPSYGVYIRPRPGRLEVCGEHATGERLRAAIAFAAGSVRACVAAVRGGAPATAQRLPAPLRLRIEAAPDRHGYLVHRHSIQGDLYATGRATALQRVDGGSTSAQAQLEAAWRCSRAALEPQLGELDLDAADARVQDTALALPVVEDVASAPPPASLIAEAAASPFGRMVMPLRRPGFELAAVMLTWEVAVLVAAALPRPRAAFACVPRACMGRFLERLDAGALDDLLTGYLREPSGGRVLADHRQTLRPALYDELGRRRRLMARELGEPAAA